MAFRRARVNIKPNVQVSRAIISNNVQSQDIPILSQEEPASQQIEITSQPITNNVSDFVPNVEETNEPVSSPPIDSFVVTSVAVVPPLPPPVSLPPSSPLPVTTTLTARPFRWKITPNIGVKTAIHHRRPSASCSGTESESESIRQKHHTLASTITFNRMASSRSITYNETQTNHSIQSITNDDMSTSTKFETTIIDTPEQSSPINETYSSQISYRIPSKITREYLTQHITYRAQRLAAKVEPEMTVRRRRAATLEKLDETGVNKTGPIDTSKLKIADFVHYNPTANPMEEKIKSTIDTNKDSIRKNSISSTENTNTNVAPQLKIDANGMLVVDEESLYIRNIDDTQRNTIIVEGRFNDDNLTHQSYRKIGRRKRWSNRDTLRFYQALRMCGTDFSLIARVFPNRNRDDIKRKFKTEDKANRTLIDSALRQRIPFDLTCFYSPSEDESTDDENEINIEQKKRRKHRRIIKRKTRQTTSSDPLEINRRREKRLQSKKNSTRIKKSAEFIVDDDDDDDDEAKDDEIDEDQIEESSMDIADTVEITTTSTESKFEQIIPPAQLEIDNSQSNFNGLENLLGQIDHDHLLFVHNTDETTGLDRIDVHVIRSNSTDEH